MKHNRNLYKMSYKYQVRQEAYCLFNTNDHDAVLRLAALLTIYSVVDSQWPSSVRSWSKSKRVAWEKSKSCFFSLIKF